MPKLENTLLELKNANDVEAVINDFCSKNNTEFSFADRMEQINECFNAKSVEEILEKLAKDNSDWAKETIKAIFFKYNFIEMIINGEFDFVITDTSSRFSNQFKSDTSATEFRC